MCIIVYKPAGVNMPSKQTLKTCFTNNDDGAGIMYRSGSLVRTIKGMMDFDTFYKQLKKIGNTKDIPVVMHFRISTQGNIDVTNCHPFPITSDVRDLSASHAKTHAALMHNGIISLTADYTSSYYYKSKKPANPYSDTFIFTRDYASLICTSPGWWRDKNKVALMTRLADSKLAILSSDGHVELIGSFVEDDGIYYSNSSYKEQAKGASYSYATSYDDWKEWDDYYKRTAKAATTSHETAVFMMALEDGDYMVTSDGEMIECYTGEHFMDARRNVYEYDWDYEFAYKLSNVTNVFDRHGNTKVYLYEHAEAIVVDTPLIE